MNQALDKNKSCRTNSNTKWNDKNKLLKHLIRFKQLVFEFLFIWKILDPD